MPQRMSESRVFGLGQKVEASKNVGATALGAAAVTVGTEPRIGCTRANGEVLFRENRGNGSTGASMAGVTRRNQQPGKPRMHRQLEHFTA